MNALALDIGLKRVGIALCVNESVAVPLNAVLRKNRKQASIEIKALLTRHDIKKLIVGLPKGGASEEEMTKRIKHFVALLEFDGEIFFVDESFTSNEAAALCANSHKKDGKNDSLAALIMIKEFFKIL